MFPHIKWHHVLAQQRAGCLEMENILNSKFQLSVIFCVVSDSAESAVGQDSRSSAENPTGVGQSGINSTLSS